MGIKEKRNIEDLVTDAGIEIDEDENLVTISLSFDENQTQQDSEVIKDFIKEMLEIY